MIKLDNSRIERLAVQAIVNEANRPGNHLLPNIPIGDKGISFDGDIQVFENENETIQSLLGRVPIQVKGTQVNKFTKGLISFTFSMEHYKNYYQNNGVLLFVVEVQQDGSTKTFYKNLLPLELKKLITDFGENKKQKSRVVYLRELEETNIQTICENFLSESPKQSIGLVEYCPIEINEFDSFSFKSLTFNPNNISTDNIFEHDFYIYGTKKDFDYPIGFGVIGKMTREGKEDFEVDGLPFNFHLKVEERENFIKVTLENSLEVIFDINDSEQQIKFNLFNFHSIASQLKVLPFLELILAGKTVSFRGVFIEMNDLDTKEMIENSKHNFKLLNEVKPVFEELSIPNETIIIGNIKDIYLKIQLIADIFVNHDYSRINKESLEKGGLLNLYVGDLRILVYYNPNEKKLLINAFSETYSKFETVLHFWESDERFAISPFIFLTSNELETCANINLRIIQDSFMDPVRVLNNVTFLWINKFCLSCITSYDNTQNTQFLELAEYVYMQLKVTELDADYEMQIEINVLQVYYRLNGSLNKEQIEVLIKMKYSAEFRENIAAMFSCNVLLNSKTEAEHFFNRLTIEERTDYLVLPIYQLYLNMN